MAKLTLMALFALFATTCGRSATDSYEVVPDWLKLPPGRLQFGQQHGDIAVSSAGEVYVGLRERDFGLLVFRADGTFLRTVPGAPDDFHGFVIRKVDGEEFLMGPRITKQSIVKMSLDGEVVLEIDAAQIPDRFKIEAPRTIRNPEGKLVPNPEAGKRIVRLSGMDVAPNGDLFVTDGYASDFVHRFTSGGEYVRTFGGKAAPYGFRTFHKLAIDVRFSPPRIIGCDRENGRVVHLSLDGAILGIVAENMRRPAAVAIWRDYAAIAEIQGRITILDKAGRVVVSLGMNLNPGEGGNNRVEPSRWRPGVLTAPHGVAFFDNGDLLVSEYSIFGRVHRFNRREAQVAP